MAATQGAGACASAVADAPPAHGSTGAASSVGADVFSITASDNAPGSTGGTARPAARSWADQTEQQLCEENEGREAASNDRVAIEGGRGAFSAAPGSPPAERPPPPAAAVPAAGRTQQAASVDSCSPNVKAAFKSFEVQQQ